MATKKTAPKKSTTTAKKTTARKKAPKKPKIVPMQSFHLYKDPRPFMTFEVTRQTAYWLVIAVISIAFTAWILKFQADINDIYNQIESIQVSEPYIPTESAQETPEA